MDSSETKLTPAQVEVIGNHVRPSTSAVLRNYVRSALVGFIILLAGVAYAIQGKSDTSALNTGLTGSCRQQQVLQAEANLFSVQAFQARIAAAQRERQLARVDAKGREAHLASARLTERQASQIIVTALADCAKAAHDSGYRFPTAGAIGNPETGKLLPGVATIVSDSQRVLRSG